VADEWDEDTTATETPDIAVSAKPMRNRPCLTVLTGSAAGQMFKLPRGPIVIGRAHNAEVRLVDDGVSRHHARLRLETDQLWVADLESRNGTFVNGVKIEKQTALRDGDKIQVGRTIVLRFAYHDELDESFHESLLSSALRDPLTKLFNKRYFMDRLDSELKFARRHVAEVSLLMLDVDHFKVINDSHGHLAGDAVLIGLATVLTKTVRNEDVVARFGGEELAVILRAIAIEPAMLLADRLRKTIEQTRVHHNDLELRATASIGVAGYPSTDAQTIEALIEAADQGLYRAKAAGRNKVSQ
jgi:two-component system cell cycle response regulator